MNTFPAHLILSVIGILLVATGTSAQHEDDSGYPWTIGHLYRLEELSSPPRAVYTPDPEYSEEARRAKCGGTLVLWLIVGPDGKPHGTKVARSLGLGLDEKAVEAVKQWMFEPAMKDGKPVAVQINVEVSFRLSEMNLAEVDVLSDTMGANFGSYLAPVLHDVRTNWCKLIPEEGHLKKGEVTIQFAILKDGQVTDMHVSSPSGDIALDHAALDGITASNPFKTLPSEFKGNYVALRMHFLYNSPAMTISPTHPEVVSGSVQQFSAAVGSTKNPAVNWSVSGAGCTGDACGTISAEGLYFAPFVVPKPPFITVKAVLTAKPSSIASASVTIVKPDRSQ